MDINAVAGWSLMLAGILLGMVIGMWSHLDNWAGGYGSYRRRMLRLAHIAALALGMINLLYSLYIASAVVGAGPDAALLGSRAMVAGGILMPIVCLLSAWRTKFRHLFAFPAICVLVAIAIMAYGQLMYSMPK